MNKLCICLYSAILSFSVFDDCLTAVSYIHVHMFIFGSQGYFATNTHFWASEMANL